MKRIVGIALLSVLASACDFFPTVDLAVAVHEEALTAFDGPVDILLGVRALDEDGGIAWEGSTPLARICDATAVTLSVDWSEQGICADSLVVTAVAQPSLSELDAAPAEEDLGDAGASDGCGELRPRWQTGELSPSAEARVARETFTFDDDERVPYHPLSSSWTGCLDVAARRIELP